MPLDASNFQAASNEPAAPEEATGVSIPSANSAVLSPTGTQTFSNAIAYGLPGLGLGLLDTMGQSLGVISDHTIPDVLKAVTGDGTNSLGDFYTRHQPQFRAGGEIAGMLLPGLAAMKVLKTARLAKEAGTFGETLMNSSAMDILLGNSADLTAKEMAISSEAIAGKEAQGVWAGKNIATPEVVAAKRGYYAARAMDAVRTTVAFEVGSRLAFNSSSTFYPADYTLTDQLEWGGIGLATGVGLELAAAKYAVRNLVQTALKGYTANASEYGTVVPNVASMTSVKDADKAIFRPNNRGVGVTQFAAMSADLQNTAELSSVPQLKTNIAQDQVNIKKVLNEQIGSMAYDTHPVLKRTVLSQDQIDLGISALKKNNTALLFATKLAQVPEDGADEFYSALQETLDGAKKDFVTAHLVASQHPDPMVGQQMIEAAAAKLAPIEAASNEIHYVLENDGRYTVYKNRADNFLDQNSFDDIKRKGYVTPDPNNPQGPGTKNSMLLAKADNNLILHDNFRAEIPKGATPNDYSALYAMGSKLIQDYKPVEGQKFILTPALPWRTIEGTLALADSSPAAKSAIQFGAAPSVINDLTVVPKTFNSFADAQFHVLNEKFKEFNSLMPSVDQKPLTGVAARVAAAKGNYTPAQVIQRLNLPEENGLTTQPLIEAFAHAKLQGMADLNDMFPVKSNTLTPANYTQMDLLQAHLRETAGITDSKAVIPTQGVLLKQNDTRPVFVAAAAAPPISRSDSQIAGLVQATRTLQLQNLAQISPQQSPLVSGVIGRIVNQDGDLTGAAGHARAVQTLQDGLVSGTGQVVGQDRINEQFPTMKAAQLLAQDTDTFTKGYVSALANSSGLSERLANTLAIKNKADLFDFNRIEQAYRHGWDITSWEKDPTGSGAFVAKLAEDGQSKINPLLMAKHFDGQEIPEGMEQYMPDMSVTALKGGYQPLRVSQKAAELAMNISDMSKQSGVENNSLRVALGKNPVKIRDFHLPTPEISKQDAWFVRNDAGNVIATYSTGNAKYNADRAQSAADILNKSPEISGTNHVAVPLEMVARDHQIADDNFFSLIDYSDQLAKTGVGIKGGLSHVEIDSGDTTLKAIVNSLQRQYLNVGIRARAAVFEPELNYARQAAVAGAAVRKDNLGAINIFDRYTSTMFSQNPTLNKGALQGIYGKIEDAFDRSLSFLNAHLTEQTGNIPNVAGAKVMRQILRKQSSAEEFAGFQKVIPNWNPIDDTAKWAESTFKEKSPWMAQPVITKLSQVSSTLALRFLDVGMSVIHLANFATNAPAVAFAMRKLPNETKEQWITRTAAWGTQVADGINTFSPMKAMGQVSKAYWKGDLTQPMLDAAKQGYFKPEYASLTQVLTRKAATTKPGQYLKTFADASVYLADHTEIMARKLSWGMGYKIAKDLHGMEDDRNAYIFANNFVNEVEGNYAPNNKPAMFAGAIGQPLGAFQTYMFNFYRRMYGYVETGNKAALLAQYSTQAGVFGAKSVPGFNLWNKTFQSNDDGSDEFTSRINRKFSPGVGELIMNGSLSNIPKIWGGMQADGFSWNTRGSADWTDVPPTIADVNRAPPLQFLAETFQGIQATVNNIFSHEGFSVQQQEEIMANFTTNRALKNIMEMAADAKTDQRGAVIQSGTRDAIHVAAALMGTQPESTQQIQNATARERSVQLTQEDARATLNSKTRAIFRSGNFGISDLQAMTQDYIKSGGNPAYLGQWFRNSFATSMTPKAYATMQELGKSGKLLEFEDMLSSIQQNQDTSKPKQGN